MSSKRTVNGTVRRKANSTCTPVWATRTSCSSSTRFRSQRSSGVSLRPSLGGPTSWSMPPDYPRRSLRSLRRGGQHLDRGAWRTLGAGSLDAADAAVEVAPPYGQGTSARGYEAAAACALGVIPRLRGAPDLSASRQRSLRD